MDDASFGALTKAFPRVLQNVRFSTEPLPAPAKKQPPFLCGAFSPDGSMIALSGGGRIPSRPAIWIARVPSFETVASIRGHQGVHSLAWDAATGLLASASNDYTAVMWDVTRRENFFVVGGDEEPIVKGHVAFAGRALFVGETEAFAGLRARLLRVSLDSGKVTTVHTGKAIKRLAVHPSGTWAIVEDDFHHPSEDRLIVNGEARAIDGPVHALGFRGDELACLVGKEKLEIRIGTERRAVDVAPPNHRASFSPNGDALAIGHAGEVTLVDVASGAVRSTFKLGASPTLMLAWSPSHLCAANADAVALVDRASGATVASIAPPAWFQSIGG